MERLVLGSAALAVFCLAATTSAQQPISRLKGRVTSDRGEPMANAQVRAEALFGYAAGTYAGQRTFTTTTNAKGEWNILGVKSGIWLFDVMAPGHVLEAVALPIQLLTTISSGASGLMLTWQLVLKVSAPPQGERGRALIEASEAWRAGDARQVRALLERVPDEADAEYLAAVGRIALVLHDTDMARAFFVRALERDPASYRAALGAASTVLIQRDFDMASHAFDAARNRTRDKDEQRFLSAAIGDLATIRVR